MFGKLKISVENALRWFLFHLPAVIGSFQARFDGAQIKCYPQSGPTILGKEVKGVNDVRNLSADGVAYIRRELMSNGIIVIRNQSLTIQEQVDFTSKLGELVVLPEFLGGDDPEPGFPSIHRVTNYWKNGTWKGNQYCFGCYWHKDGDFQGAKRDYIVSLLYAEEVHPMASTTRFLDNCKAFENMPDMLKKEINGTVMTVDLRKIPAFKNCREEDFAQYPNAAERHIFYLHPENGRQCVYVAVMMTTKEKINYRKTKYLRQAWDHVANQPVYEHIWKQGDVIIWDNLAVMHRAHYPPNHATRDRRMLYRTQARIMELNP